MCQTFSAPIGENAMELSASKTLLSCLAYAAVYSLEKYSASTTPEMTRFIIGESLGAMTILIVWSGALLAERVVKVEVVPSYWY